jgi:hypothetical protein
MKKTYLLSICLLFVVTVTNAQLVKIEKDGKFGFSNAAGKVVIPAKYDSVGSFQNGYAVVRLKHKFGYAFENGRVSAVKYDTVWVKDPLYPGIGLKGKKGAMDTSGREFVPPIYDVVGRVKDGFAIVQLNDRYGVVNQKGKEVLKPIYDGIGIVSNGSVIVHLDDKCGRADLKKGNVVMTDYEKIGQFKDGLAWVRLNKKYGYINTKGDLVIPLIYDDARDFNEGLAPVRTGGRYGKYGFIDKNNHLVIPLKYDNAFIFSDGKGLIKLNGRVGYVDKDGNESWTESVPGTDTIAVLDKNN